MFEILIRSNWYALVWVSRNGRDQAVKFSYVSLEQRVRQDLPLQ
jgi:hypothetical protein